MLQQGVVERPGATSTIDRQEGEQPVLKAVLGALVPLLAAVVAFAFGAIMLLALGASPLEGLNAMLDGAFGSGSRIAATAVKATPLILVGAGITIAFRTSVINIGGESQIIAGALLSTVVALSLPDLPAFILVPLVLLAGAIGGTILGAIPGALKAYASVNEILSTIMLNLVMVQFMNFLLRGPLIDPFELEAGTRIPQTQRLSDNAVLPTLIDGTRLHIGVPVAVLAAVVAYLVLWRTPTGFRLRAVGHSPEAARAAGINVKRNVTLAMALSGSLAGIAGSILVFGSEGQRMVTDGSAAGFTGSAGFNGIVAALFGGLHPLWTIPSAMLFGALLTGATQLQRVLQVPAALAVALNGIIVIFVISSTPVRGWLQRSLADSGLFNRSTDHVEAD
jgi:simple sugar transport system permease protein